MQIGVATQPTDYYHSWSKDFNDDLFVLTGRRRGPKLTLLVVLTGRSPNLTLFVVRTERNPKLTLFIVPTGRSQKCIPFVVLTGEISPNMTPLSFSREEV